YEPSSVSRVASLARLRPWRSGLLIAMRPLWVLLTLAALLLQPPKPRIEILRSTGGLPAHIAGSLPMPPAVQQSDAGQYFVFDRRAHAVYTVANDAAKKIIEVGAEA